LAKDNITLPTISIRDGEGLDKNEIVLFWDGNEAWRQVFQSDSLYDCADAVVEQIRQKLILE
jgi:hypothetical protein